MPVSSVSEIVQILCQFSDRRLGSESNQIATQWVAQRLEDHAWYVERQEFDCMDWICNLATLTIGRRRFEIRASPYSPPTDISTQMVIASTVEELEVMECEGFILLLYGELTQEPLMPKNFPFFNPEAHQQLIALLERKSPAAILTATGRHPALAGGVYPFPMIEDGDFDIPSAYLTDRLGQELAKHQHRQAHLVLDAQRIPSRGANVIASKHGQRRSNKLIVCAHLDTKMNTPGALDNAAGVGVLMLLAEKLESYSDHLGIELIVFNGEDTYGANGEKAYLDTLRQFQKETLLAVNVDAAGYVEGSTSYSLYDCSEAMASIATKVFSAHPEMVQGELWYQSDHMVFVQNGVPAMAITSQRFPELTATITHTQADLPQLVDGSKLEAIADALVDLIHHLNQVDL